MLFKNLHRLLDLWLPYVFLLYGAMFVIRELFSVRSAAADTAVAFVCRIDEATAFSPKSSLRNSSPELSAVKGTHNTGLCPHKQACRTQPTLLMQISKSLPLYNSAT